jgi:hypothetical protein
VFAEKGIDILEDMIDLFWEQPFAFATFVHHRYRHEMIDVFAGRNYDEHQPNAGIRTFRKMLQRERTYESEDVYSLPIGSRFHPERAAIWEPGSDGAPFMEETESWMGPR